MPGIHLRVLLPRNRDVTGCMIVEVDGRQERHIPVLGRGSRGPGDTWRLEKGNTPTGVYEGSELADTSAWNQDSYGPWGAVRLKPLSGNALLAEQQLGRRRLLIHGGTPMGPNVWRGEGALNPTWGCLRISNQDMRALRDIIFATARDEADAICRPVDVGITVDEF